jgi:hypothetical protein
MPIAITILQIQEGTDGVEVFGSLAFSGAYPTGGDIIDWTTVTGVQTSNGRIFTPSALPVIMQIDGTTGDQYGWILGTALNNGKIKINTASNTELGAGAYPARITGDTNVYFDAAFPKLL